MKVVSVIGCGWLGFPLAKLLINKGFSVKGSTTQQEKISLLENAGIEAYLFNNENFPDNLFKANTLVINIPPSKIKENYAHLIETIILKTNSETHIIFISSTSVYTENEGIIDESITPRGNQYIIDAENVVLSSNRKSTVLRYGGLTGPDRDLSKFFAGKFDVQDGNNAVNLIHLTDSIQVIYEVIFQEKTGVFNVCAPLHPSKNEYYTSVCGKLNKALPQFKDEISTTLTGKIINVDKLISSLNYQFIYPDPLKFEF